MDPLAGIAATVAQALNLSPSTVEVALEALLAIAAAALLLDVFRLLFGLPALHRLMRGLDATNSTSLLGLAMVMGGMALAIYLRLWSGPDTWPLFWVVIGAGVVIWMFGAFVAWIDGVVRRPKPVPAQVPPALVMVPEPPPAAAAPPPPPRQYRVDVPERRFGTAVPVRAQLPPPPAPPTPPAAALPPVTAQVRPSERRPWLTGGEIASVVVGGLTAYFLLTFVHKFDAFGVTCYYVGEFEPHTFCAFPIAYWVGWAIAAVFVIAGLWRQVSGRDPNQG